MSGSWMELAGLVAGTCHDVYGRKALYLAAGEGPGTLVSVVLHPALEEMDLPGAYGGGRFAARGQRVELRVSQVPAPAAGDEVHLQDSSNLRLCLQGEPRLEAEGTLWLCDAHEVRVP